MAAFFVARLPDRINRLRSARHRLPWLLRFTVPTGLAAFPAEFMPPPPRADVEAQINLLCWTEMKQGGHFGAWEQPELFATEVGEFFGSVD